MKIVLIYIDNHRKITGYLFVNEWLISKAADLSLGLAAIKTYSRLDPDIKKNCKFVNRVYIDHLTDDFIVEDILSQDPDLVGFSINLWNLEKTKRIWKIIKNKNPKIKIVLGGPMVPDDVELSKKMLYSNHQIDALIKGEGEIPFRQLIRYYLKKEKASRIPNASIRQGENIFVNKERICLKKLSKIPSPYLTGEAIIHEGATGLLALETSRGCPFDCAYCRYHGGERPRFFDIERVRQEFELLHKKNFQGTIFITDPLLNVNKKHAKAILKIMEGIKNRLCVDIRLEFIDYDIIELFKKIPGLDLSVGIQSINPLPLKNINRPTDIKKCRETLLKLTSEGIGVGTDLIMGLPGDNYNTFKKTIDWVVYCGVEKVDINDLIIIPNTPLERFVKKFNIKHNKENMVLSSCTFSKNDMVKASHFKIVFQFLFGFYRQILNVLIYKLKLKPSEIIEKFVSVAVRRKEIPSRRLLNLNGIYFSDKTFLSFLKYTLKDEEMVRQVFKLFKELTVKLEDNENYKIEFRRDNVVQ